MPFLCPFQSPCSLFLLLPHFYSTAASSADTVEESNFFLSCSQSSKSHHNSYQCVRLHKPTRILLQYLVKSTSNPHSCFLMSDTVVLIDGHKRWFAPPALVSAPCGMIQKRNIVHAMIVDLKQERSIQQIDIELRIRSSLLLSEQQLKQNIFKSTESLNHWEIYWGWARDFVRASCPAVGYCR